jgi:hypothetical protein
MKAYKKAFMYTSFVYTSLIINLYKSKHFIHLLYSINPSLCTDTLDVELVKIVDTIYLNINIIHCTLI